MIDEKALEAACAAFANETGMPRDRNEDEIIRAAITAYLQALRPGSTGDWVLVPKDLAERAQHALSASNFSDDRCVAAEVSAMLAAAGGREG